MPWSVDQSCSFRFKSLLVPAVEDVKDSESDLSAQIFVYTMKHFLSLEKKRPHSINFIVFQKKPDRGNVKQNLETMMVLGLMVYTNRDPNGFQ